MADEKEEGQEPEGKGWDSSPELDRLEAEAEADEQPEAEFVGKEGEGQADAMSSADVCTLLAQTTFSVIAVRRGAHWELSKDEAAKLGEAYGVLMDKYLPEGTSGPELTAVMVTAMIVFPRAQQEQESQPAGGADETG